MIFKASCALVCLASVAVAQTTTLETKPDSPVTGVRGQVELVEGDAPSLRFTWTSGSEDTFSGRRLGRDAWLFVEPAAQTPRQGLADVLEDAAAEPKKLGEVNASALNLREGPGTEHAIGRTAQRGEQLVVVGRRGNWLQLEDAGRTLWAHRRYVRATGGFVPGQRSISLRRQGEHYQAVIRQDQTVLATQPLRDSRPTVLLVSVESYGGFPESLIELNRYYRERGYRVRQVVEGTHLGLTKLLEDAAQTAPFSRVVISTHSGWDGPIWDDGQVEVHEPGFPALAAAFRAGTTLDAKIYVSGCHAAGSNRFEDPSKKIWIRDLARESRRVVAGPTGPTSAVEHTRRQTLAALEGVGTVIQETVLATPTEVVRWGGGLSRTTGPNEAQPAPPALELAPIDISGLVERHRNLQFVAPMPEIDFQIGPPDFESELSEGLGFPPGY